MTSVELRELIAKGSTPFLLDVRNPSELRMAGAIPGVVNIPLGELDRRLGELPSDRSTPIVAICQSGARSMSAAHTLLAAGYTDVTNLEGGTGAWMRSAR
jgi:rhodanese-related sulfurtransferase